MSPINFRKISLLEPKLLASWVSGSGWTHGPMDPQTKIATPWVELLRGSTGNPTWSKAHINRGKVNIMHWTLVSFLSHHVSQVEVFLTLMHASLIISSLPRSLKITRIFPIHFWSALYKIFTPAYKWKVYFLDHVTAMYGPWWDSGVYILRQNCIVIHRAEVVFHYLTNNSKHLVYLQGRGLLTP